MPRLAYSLHACLVRKFMREVKFESGKKVGRVLYVRYTRYTKTYTETELVASVSCRSHTRAKILKFVDIRNTSHSQDKELTL